MLAFSIQPLEPKSILLPKIAVDEFEYWGALTGYRSRASYESFLERAAQSATLPRVLVACSHGCLFGSVNLLANDMTTRPQFTPWMGQLFVSENRRSLGVGTALVDAAASYAGSLGYRQLFLYTSGTLPDYYRKRGWIEVENIDYLGKVRTIMRREIKRTNPWNRSASVGDRDHLA
jgi:GNAT superfamily N-acetyltransferase